MKADAQVEPAALARQALFDSLPVPIKNTTKGQLTRDFQQQQFERETAKLADGAPLREAFNDQNAALLDNFAALRSQAPHPTEAEAIYQNAGNLARPQRADMAVDYDNVLSDIVTQPS